MKKLRVDQWAGIAGIGTAVMFLVSAAVLPLGDFPASDSPAQEVATWVSDHRGGVIAAVILNGIGSAGLVILFAGLRQRLGDGWSDLGYAAGVLTVAIFTTGFAALIASAYRVDAASPENVQLFGDFAFATFAISSVPTIFAFAAYSVSILSTGRLPAWLGWAGFAVAVVHIGAVAALTSSSGAFSLEGEFGKYVPASAYLMSLALGIELLRAKKLGRGR